VSMPKDQDFETYAFLDFETNRMGVSNVLPKAICLTGLIQYQSEEAQLVGAGPDEYIWGNNDNGVHLRQAVETVLDDPKCLIVFHNASFDLGVIAANWPDLLPKLWVAMADEGRVHCTKIRAKLLDLADTGDLDFVTLPGGVKAKTDYSLAGQMKFWFGVDRTAEKNSPESWRTNFDTFDGWKAEDYPEDARTYCLDDVRDLEKLWLNQTNRQQGLLAVGVDAFAELPFRVSCDFAMRLMTSYGMQVDAEWWHKLVAWLEVELLAEKVQLLVQNKILRPYQPSRPHAKGHKNPDGTVKMTKPVEESIDKGALKNYILTLKKKIDETLPEGEDSLIELRYTEPSDNFPEGQLQVDAEWLTDFAYLDPTLEQYQHRQKLQKLLNTDLPRMTLPDAEGKHTNIPAERIHPEFNVLVSTGRTSSSASTLYPSGNAQNFHPKARQCIVPPEGYGILSIDYRQLELCTLAQKCYDLFGASVLRDKINAGVDTHAFLGGAIAYNLDNDFRKACDDGGATSIDDIYEAFKPLKKHEDENLSELYDKYRKFAKPTGLGYPGGLMPRTFIAYAKKLYGLVVDFDTAKLLREVWLQVYPEMDQFFDWVKNNCEDNRNGPVKRKVKRKIEGEIKEFEIDSPLYAYTSPLGLHRAGCTFTEVANGIGLQSPSADGALIAVMNVSRACYDTSLGSILLDDANGVRYRPQAFIHDEILGIIRLDDNTHEIAEEVARIMEASMKEVCPDVSIRTDKALMLRWHRDAEPVKGPDGRIALWTPKSED